MIKHEFPIYIWPRTCRWPASTWFPFLQQSLTQRYKIHSMFNLKMKWSCKRLRGALTNIQHCIYACALSLPKTPWPIPFPIPLPLEKSLNYLSSFQGQEELWADIFWSFLPISTERTMISWCCFLPFKSCKYWLTPLLILLVILTFYYQLKLLSPSYLWSWV